MAARRIKGITIEIGGDTTKLVSAISKVDNAIKTTQGNLRDIEKALKLDPTSTNLLRDKQKELGDAVKEAKEKLETEKKALDQMKNTKGFDVNSEAAKKLQTQIDLDTAALKNAEKQLKEFGSVGSQQMKSNLSKIDEAIKTTQNNLVDIEKSLKLDPTSTNLLRDKQKELRDAVGEAKEKLETEKRLLEEMKKTEGFDANSEAAKKLQTQIDLDTAALKEAQKELKEFGSVGSQQMKAVGQHVEEVGNKIKSIGSGIAQVGQDLTTKLSVPIVGAFGSAVKITADFDSQMSKVKAISGATGDEFDALRDKARDMGATTKFSATEAGQAFEYMGMAGWKTEDMLNGITGIMNLAAASGEELGTTSDILTDALTAFGLEAKDSARFADILASAATNANTNVSMMGESFKYVAPVAGSLGYSAEDVAVALGLMANSGIKADMAGTSLRNMFQRMAKPTKESAEAMDRLGLSLQDDEGKMYSFREIMDQMRSSFSEINMSAADYDKAVEQLDADLADGTLTQKKYDAALEELNKQAFGAEGAEKARAAAMLGGTRAMSGLLAIANATEKDYNDLINAIDSSSDTFAKLADGSVVPLNEALQSGQEILETYEGQAAAMAATMEDNLEGEITKLKSALQELAISFGDLLMPKIREIVEGVQGFIDKLNAMDDAQREQIIKIAAIVAAIGPVLLVIGKVVSGIGSVIAMIGKVTAALAGISAPILAAIAVIGLLAAAFVSLYNSNEEFRNKVDTTFAGLKEKLTGVWDAIKPLLEELGAAFSSLMDTLEPIFAAIMDFVAGLLEGVLSAVPSIIEAVTNAVSFITEIIQAFIALFNGDFDSFFDHLKSAAENLFNYWKNIYKSGLDAIVGFFNHFGVDIKAKIQSVVTNIQTTWTNLLSSARTYAANISTAIMNGIGRAIDWIKSLPSQAWKWGADLIDGIAQGIRDKISTITDAITSVADVIASYIHFSEPDIGPLSKFHTFMPDMMKELAKGIDRGMPMLEKAMDTMATKMVPKSPSLSAGAGSRSTTINNSFSFEINGANQDPLQMANQITEIVQDKINSQIISREAAFQ